MTLLSKTIFFSPFPHRPGGTTSFGHPFGHPFGTMWKYRLRRARVIYRRPKTVGQNPGEGANAGKDEFQVRVSLER